jgi:transposase
MTRNGKIARLPHDIREQLNRRLEDGEQGKRLVTWLNSLPTVRAVMQSEFGGRPIREQSLSEWRKGGFRDWQLQQEALELMPRIVREAGELKGKVDGELTNHMAIWISAHLMAVMRRLIASTDLGDTKKWKLLHEACADIVALRRGDQNAEWLRLDRERLQLEERDSTMKFKKRIVTGLETLLTYVNHDHPEAKAAFEALSAKCLGPLDKIEGAP